MARIDTAYLVVAVAIIGISLGTHMRVHAVAYAIDAPGIFRDAMARCR